MQFLHTNGSLRDQKDGEQEFKAIQVSDAPAVEIICYRNVRDLIPTAVQDPTPTLAFSFFFSICWSLWWETVSRATSIKPIGNVNLPDVRIAGYVSNLIALFSILHSILRARPLPPLP